MRRLSFWFMGGLAMLPLAVIAWILTAPLRVELHPAFYGACVVGGAIALHGVLTFAESRGWIYYRKRTGSYGGLGVTSEWLNMYDPSRKHLQIATRVQEWQREEDDDGDDRSVKPRRGGLRDGRSLRRRRASRAYVAGE